MTEIVQIVPYLPPAISGVGDYALLLAQELRGKHDIHTRFIVGNPDWAGPSEVNGFPVVKVGKRATEPLAQLLLQLAGQGVPVYLHYVGYGFETRGCPFWLVRGLKTWRATGENRQLITMFHELYARGGAVWTSSFWNSPFQRRLAAQLAGITDICWTNRNRLRAEIEKMDSGHAGRVRTLPVFSNFGEPASPGPLASRKSQAVLFGGLGRGLRDNSQAQKILDEALQHVGIGRLAQAGARSSCPLRLRVPVVDLGALPATKANEVLGEMRVGVLDYFDGELAKSGIFAAYCAHGVTTMLITRNASEGDGLKAGAQFLVASELKVSVPLPEQQKVLDRAREWYAGHNLSRTASLLAEDIAAAVLVERLPFAKDDSGHMATPGRIHARKK